MIKERISQILEHKKIAKENFYKKIGMTSANFRGNAKSTPINSTAIENILSEIPDINLEWLLTGKGAMLRQPEENFSANNATPQPQPNDSGYKNKYIALLEEHKAVQKELNELQKKYAALLEKNNA
ncbi:MAG: hypothetical protein LBT94_03680 [Prevotellaceae bacterium]|jgi:hypothetical protein|nr:hypothetical protein [Prevotellaceae bacterium]